MKKLISVLLMITMLVSISGTCVFANAEYESYDGQVDGDGTIDAEGFIVAYNNLVLSFLKDSLDQETVETIYSLLKLEFDGESDDGYCTYSCIAERSVRLYYADGTPGSKVNRFEYIGKFDETFPKDSTETVDARLISYFFTVCMLLKEGDTLALLSDLDGWLMDNNRPAEFVAPEYTVTYTYEDGQVHFLFAWNEGD